MNLCDICLRKYSDCVNEHENIPEIVYGNNETGTNDAVLECSWFMGKTFEDFKKIGEVWKAIYHLKL